MLENKLLRKIYALKKDESLNEVVPHLNVGRDYEGP
jgi:hypothetical protein